MKGIPLASTTTPSVSVDHLRDENGYFSMVAVDQRGSLRAMLAEHAGGRPVGDDDLAQFKLDVATELAPGASALLLDRDYGFRAAGVSPCPVILAADVLSASVPGGPVDTATIDRDLTAEIAHDFNAQALKMLVPWTYGTRSEAVDLAHEFMGVARRMGLPGIVEGVVRPPDFATWSIPRRNDALVAAAQDLAATAPDLYKAEIIYPSPEHHDAAREASKGITAAMPVPWVILSSGVPGKHFGEALAAAVEGGAEGFLAGRALWADACGAPDVAAFLRTTSSDRLATLAATVVATTASVQT
jgi:sulfofructosephosphate aldolase